MQLLHEESIRRILGKVEIETIMKRLKGERLSQTERNYLSRSVRPKLIAARLLSEGKLLEKIQRKENIRELIIYNLDNYGYELISPRRIKKHNKIPIEELVCLILTRMQNARFIEGIPIILLKNKINKYKLIELATKYNIRNKIGFLLETAMIIALKLKLEIPEFDGMISYLKVNEEADTNLGEYKDELYQEFLGKTTPIRLKKWNLFGRFFDEDFINQGETYL